jgi:hypothetical protein
MMQISGAALHLTIIAAVAFITGCRQPAQAAVTEGVQDFVAAARAASVRYQSQDSAIADGFHRVGDDFPAMGVHWVNLARIMADSFAASRPTVLTYISVNGAPRLAGVAYTALLAPGENPPRYAPAVGHWHEHNGSIAEESFLAGHDAHTTTAGLRLAILHAWIWIENPDGVFTTDNWALPFARMQITPTAPHDAARAVALATDAGAFYRDALDEVLRPSADERARYEVVLRRSALAAESVLRSGVTRGDLTTAEAGRLATLWPAMWSALATALPERATAVRELERRLSN